MTERLPNPNLALKSFAPPSDLMRAAALLEREELLNEEVRFASDSSYRRRLEIEAELSDIRREITRLGFAASR
jgi:hypothetical protein